MNVYVLVVEVVDVDGGKFQTTVNTYDDIEKAQKDFEDLRVAYIEDYKNCDFEQKDFIPGDMNWSIWEKDHCYDNRVEITIYESEVR